MGIDPLSRVAIVTGAGGGLDAALAMVLSQCGVKA